MRALIIGAGDAGTRLAHKLCSENHEVVVIDEDAAALSKLEATLNIMTVVGHGANPAILEEAQIKKANVVVSVTKNWDTNILAGMMAKRAGAKHVVARVGDTDYLQKFDFFNVKEMGIDYAINPCEQCAQDIANMLSLPGTRETVSLLEGRVIALEQIGVAALGAADVVDQDVYATELADGPPHRLASTVPIARVCHDAECAKLLGLACEGFRMAPRDHDPRSLGDQRRCDRRTDPARAARHHRHLVRQTGHAIKPPSTTRIWPVMNEAVSDASMSTKAEVSS